MENFVLLLKKHKRLGYLFSPWIIEKQRDYYQLKYMATTANSIGQKMTEEEGQILKLIEEYDEHILNKLFDNRRLSVKEFWQKLEDEKIENYIRPYIEKRLVKIFLLLRKQPTELFFLSDPKTITIYFDQKMNICTFPTETVFNFEKHLNGIKYFLTLRSVDEEINLFKKSGFVLVNKPCLVRIENKLMLFEDIDGKKLSPFFRKRFIVVPPRMEETYFKGFIKKSIEKFRVNASGFEIREEEPEKTAVLHLETDFTGEFHLILTFGYGKKEVQSNEIKQLFVRMEIEKGEYIFYRLKRNTVWEEEMAEFLRRKMLRESPKGIFKPRTKLIGELQKQFFVTELSKIIDELNDTGFKFIQEKEQKEYSLGKIQLDIKKSEKSVQADFFGVNAMVKSDEFQIPFHCFRKHILNGNREYVLPNGKIAVLPENWFDDYHDLLQFSEKNGDEIIVKNIHLPLLNNIKENLPEEIVHKFRQLLNAKNKKTEPLPKGLKGTLRSYQQEGYFWMINLRHLGFGACLADDMGLGKTLQTITLLMRNKELNRNGRIPVKQLINQNQPFPSDLFTDIEKAQEETNGYPNLIVAPKSLIFNWLEEFEKFAPSFKIKVADLSVVRNMDKHVSYDAFLITYGLLRRNVEKLKNIPFETMVLDESQIIKNPASLTYQAVMQCHAKQKIILTGTPVENSLIDLWAQMNFINPGLLGNLPFFKKEYISVIGKKNGEERMKKLRSLIYPFLLRRTKAEVEKDLPSLTIQQVKTQMTEEQAVLYETIRVKTRNALYELIETNRRNKNSILILQGIMKLRQAANHPKLIVDDYAFSSGKYEEGLNLLHTLLAEEHKVLVFSSFVKHLQLYADYYQQQDVSFEMLTGSDSQNARKEKVHRFQTDKNCRIFFVSLKAGGFGLNLTAADYVLLLDPWWNPAAEMQAINRAHRIGQNKKVIAYKLISKDTIEEKIFMYQQRKSQLVADILSTDEGVLKNLSDTEIMELFSE